MQRRAALSYQTKDIFFLGSNRVRLRRDPLAFSFLHEWRQRLLFSLEPKFYHHFLKIQTSKLVYFGVLLKQEYKLGEFVCSKGLRRKHLFCEFSKLRLRYFPLR